MGGGICLWQRPNAAMYSPHVPELAINEPFAIEVDHRRGGSKRRALAVVAIAFLGLGAFVALSGSDNAALDSTSAASTSLPAADPTELLDLFPTGKAECAQKQQSLCGYCGTGWPSCWSKCQHKRRHELHKVCSGAAAATELGAAATPTTEDAACDKSFCYSTCPKYSCCANGGKCPGCGSAEARQCFNRCNGCPRAATTTELDRYFCTQCAADCMSCSFQRMRACNVCAEILKEYGGA